MFQGKTPWKDPWGSFQLLRGLSRWKLPKIAVFPALPIALVQLTAILCKKESFQIPRGLFRYQGVIPIGVAVNTAILGNFHQERPPQKLESPWGSFQGVFPWDIIDGVHCRLPDESNGILFWKLFWPTLRKCSMWSRKTLRSGDKFIWTVKGQYNF